jgi:hypothetical protein
MNNYLSSLKELYEHPDNGKPGVYLAAFLSADKTYPIFVTKVTRHDSIRFTATGIGFKWGYDSPDKMNETFYSDDQLAREVSRQFFAWNEVHAYRFAPQWIAVPLPLAIQNACRFLPLKTYSLTYNKDTEIEDDWRYTALAIAISFPHALWQLRQQVADTCNIRHEEIDRPRFLVDVCEL